MNAEDFSAEDEEALRNFLPNSFGKQDRAANVQAQIDAARRPVADAAKKRSPPPSDVDSDDDDDSGDSQDDDDEFPTSHELVIRTHDRAVTTVSLDPKGTRMVTGSTDCTLKFHDFSAMAPNTIRAFRSVDPTAAKPLTAGSRRQPALSQPIAATGETHPIHCALFNPLSPQHVLCVSALPQPRLFDRDGDMLAEFAKGDMYLRDMHNTKGHVSEATCASWSPANKQICATGGTDSTVRIWDVSRLRQQQTVIVHKSRAAGSGGRSRITAIAWGPSNGGGDEGERGGVTSGGVIVAAAFDGALSLHPGNGPFTRPAGEIRDAHEPGTWTSGVDISPDGRLVATRGGDGKVKIFDTRKFTRALNSGEVESTSSQYPTTSIRFSPTGSALLTGSAAGDLLILNPATLRPEHTVAGLTPGSPILTAQWHPALKQIITSSANGTVHILFSPALSSPNRGALAILSRIPKRRNIDDSAALTTATDAATHGIAGDTVHAHLAASSGRPSARASDAATGGPKTGLTVSGRPRDPRRPHLPAQTPFARSAPSESHIERAIPLSSMRDEDPREALLRYAGAESLFTRAWKETQPETLYAELSDEEEVGEGEGEGEKEEGGGKRVKR